MSSTYHWRSFSDCCWLRALAPPLCTVCVLSHWSLASSWSVTVTPGAWECYLVVEEVAGESDLGFWKHCWGYSQPFWDLAHTLPRKIIFSVCSQVLLGPSKNRDHQSVVFSGGRQSSQDIRVYLPFYFVLDKNKGQGLIALMVYQSLSLSLTLSPPTSYLSSLFCVNVWFFY